MEYDNQKINQTELCYWDGSLNFDSISQVLAGPRAVMDIVGFFTMTYTAASLYVLYITLSSNTNKVDAKTLVKEDSKNISIPLKEANSLAKESETPSYEEAIRS